MKTNKISVNLFYNTLNQLLNVLLPFITAPYVARVLSPRLIGTYSYVLANNTYFMNISLLGLPLVGMLRAAAVRDDKEKLSILFWEMMISKIILGILGTLAYGCVFLMRENENRILYWIMLLNIWGNVFDITWLLNSLEEFKTMSLRNMGVKLASVILILLFVKGPEDFFTYVLIMQLSAFGGYVIVLPLLHSRIQWINPRRLNLLQHAVPAVIYFFPGIVNAIFSSADKTVLGFMSTKTEVGYYEEANKLCLLLESVISSFGNVLLPRTVYMLNNNGLNKNYQELLDKFFRGLYMISLPVTLGIFLISEDFVAVMFGPGYEKSAVLLRILCFHVLLTTISNLCGQQFLVARGRQNAYNLAISIAAVINLLLNCLLVHDYQSVGVSLASSLSSVAVFIIIAIMGRNVMRVNRLFKLGRNYFLAGGVMFLVCWLIPLNQSNIMNIIVQMILGAATYISALIFLKDDMLKEIFHKTERNME